MTPLPGDVVIIGPLAVGRPDFVPVTVRVVSVEPEEWDPTYAVVHGLVLRGGGRVVGKLIVTVHLPHVRSPV